MGGKPARRDLAFRGTCALWPGRGLAARSAGSPSTPKPAGFSGGGLSHERWFALWWPVGAVCGEGYLDLLSGLSRDSEVKLLSAVSFEYNFLFLTFASLI